MVFSYSFIERVDCIVWEILRSIFNFFFSNEVFFPNDLIDCYSSDNHFHKKGIIKKFLQKVIFMDLINFYGNSTFIDKRDFYGR